MVETRLHTHNSMHYWRITSRNRRITSRYSLLSIRPWRSYFGFSTILCISARKSKVVFLIDRTTLRQEFMMLHTIAIEENSEQNLLISPNLSGGMGVWFKCHSHIPMIRHQLWPFWASLDRRWTSSTFP